MTTTTLKKDIAKLNGVKQFSQYQNANIVVSIAQLHYGIECNANGDFVKEVGAVVLLSKKWN